MKLGSAATRPVRFLIVEDDDAHAELICRNLRRSGFPHIYERVSDGRQAIDFLRREGEFAFAERPDVVLLDLKLPRMTGHEVLDQIKNDPKLRSLPVVVLTTSDAIDDRLRAYDLRANSYLVKPLDYDQFRQVVTDMGSYWGRWNRPSPDC